MSDFTSFQESFKGEIVTPTDPDYKKAIARWASNAERNAKIVAFVKDAEDVAVAISYAKANKLPLAIRGGGHSSSGASSSEDGLVIDLSKHLNGVRIDPENKLAYVGGGALWGAVDKAAIQHGLAGVAGTVNHTGVGGLTLGGGFGWLSGEHGLVVDNLAQVTLVTADGEIRKLDKESNPDLFWAVRGGGCNFGVAVEFVYRLHPQRPTVYSGFMVFPPPVLEKLIPQTASWWEKGPKPKEGLVEALTRGPDGQPCVVVFVFYNGSEADGRANFQWLFDLNPVLDATKEIPFEELNAQQNAHLEHGVPTYMKGVLQTKPSIEVAYECLAKIVQVTESRPDALVTLMFECFPLGKINSLPNDATACQRMRYPNVLNVIRWKDNTEEGVKWAQKSTRLITDVVIDANHAQGGVDKMIGYGNYDPEIDLGEGGAISDKAHVLYGTNYHRLQQLKKQYDPDLLFSKWFPIQPAV